MCVTVLIMCILHYARRLTRFLGRSLSVEWLDDGQPCWMYIVCIYEYEDEYEYVIWGGRFEGGRVCIYVGR